MSTPLPPTPARRLGKTGIEVSPLGLAGNYGLAAGDLVRAFHELGLRYFQISPSLTDGIGQLVRDGHRDRIVLAGGAVVVGAGSVRRAWEAAAQSLRVEVIDVWHVYWVRTRLAVRASVWQEMERLKREGRVRALAISCHDRRLARRLVDDLGLDAVMI